MKTLFLKYNSFVLTDEVVQWIISSGITKVKISKEYNNPIDNLPDTIKKISINTIHFKQKINKWPSNLESLDLNIFSTFNFDITQVISDFPKTIKNLKLECYENNYPELPTSLKKLIILYPMSSKSFEKLNNLSHLEIHNCRVKIDRFPPNLKHLQLGEYDYIIDNLPKNLTHLTCSIFKDNNILPPKLLFLECSVIYSARPFMSLPEKLQEVNLSWDLHVEEEIFLPKLPNSIVKLNLMGYLQSPANMQHKDFVYPKRLQSLTIYNSNISIKNLPSTLKNLSITLSEQYYIDDYDKIVLPDGLKTFEFVNNNQNIVNFPSTLTTLDIGFNELIIHPKFTFPPKIKNLSVCSKKLLEYNKTIPSSLTYLYLKKPYLPDNCCGHDKIIFDILEPLLDIGDDFNKNIMEKIPLSVTKLRLHHVNTYDYKLLPPNVKTLTLDAYNDRIIGEIVGTVENIIINAQIRNITIPNFNEGLKKLVINALSINENVLENLPSSLEVLDIQLQNSNTKLSNLPNGIKIGRFDLGKKTDYNVLLENLPESLKMLYLRTGKYNQNYSQKINYQNLPTNLKFIDFN